MLDDFTKNELLKKKSIMYLICVKDLSFEGVNSLYLFLENQLFYNACALAVLDLTTPRPKLSRTHNTQRIDLYSISLTLQNKRKFLRLYNLISKKVEGYCH